jgi:periplasmic protein TonB
MNLHSRRWSELIFENRPKDYGAFRMRVNSSKRHLFSFLAVIALISLFYGCFKLYDFWTYQKFQAEEEKMMTEQYELLNTIFEENLYPDVKIPRIPTPVDAPEDLTNAAEPPKTIKQAFNDILNNPTPEIDPYLEELTEEEKKLDKVEPKKEEPVDDQLYTTVDRMAMFPGGTSGLISYLVKNLHYPKAYKLRETEKKILCSFIVDINGTIKQVQVLKPVDPMLDKEALRVIRSMPIWKPAMKNGKPIRVKYILPVNFRIQ